MRNFHITTDDMLVDKWVGDYVDGLAKHEMQMDEAGVFESLPSKLTAGSGKGRTIFKDENGLKFDHLRDRAPGAPSVIKKLGKYMYGNGGKFTLIDDWAKDQASDSWSLIPKALKVFMSENRTLPSEEFWWGDHGKTREQTKLTVRPYLDDDKYRTTWTIQHAYRQRFLRGVDFKHNNRRRRVVNLARTESVDVMGIHKMDTGDLSKMTRGAAESFSLVSQVSVNDKELTYQEVPHTRIFGSYFHSQRGKGVGMFYGDDENEFVAMAEGVDVFYDSRGGAKAASMARRTRTVPSCSSISTSCHRTGSPSATARRNRTLSARPKGRPPIVRDRWADICLPQTVNPPSPSSHSPGFRGRLAVATTSAWKPVGVPVGSRRKATDATETPSSSPIMCVGRYSAAYCPLASGSMLYSRKHRRV